MAAPIGINKKTAHIANATLRIELLIEVNLRLAVSRRVAISIAPLSCIMIAHRWDSLEVLDKILVSSPIMPGET